MYSAGRSGANHAPQDRPGEDTEAIMYFDFLLPRLKEAYPDARVLSSSVPHLSASPRCPKFRSIRTRAKNGSSPTFHLNRLAEFQRGRCPGATKLEVRCYEGLQHPGDLIFVPGDRSVRSHRLCMRSACVWELSGWEGVQFWLRSRGGSTPRVTRVWGDERHMRVCWLWCSEK